MKMIRNKNVDFIDHPPKRHDDRRCRRCGGSKRETVVDVILSIVSMLRKDILDRNVCVVVVVVVESKTTDVG